MLLVETELLGRSIALTYSTVTKQVRYISIVGSKSHNSYACICPGKKPPQTIERVRAYDIDRGFTHL